MSPALTTTIARLVGWLVDWEHEIVMQVEIVLQMEMFDASERSWKKMFIHEC
jgi:hypothetical protein